MVNIKNIKFANGFSASRIIDNANIPIALDKKSFSCNMFRMDLDIESLNKWDGVTLKCGSIAGIYSGAATLKFDIIYRWRAERNDTWLVQTPWGKIPADREVITRFARFANKTVNKYAEDNGIDFSKPDIPEQTGAGQQFYAELVSDGTVVDAYYLGDSEDLGFADDEVLGFYGKKQVVFYIDDSTNINFSNFAIKLYKGKPENSYSGVVWFGPWTVENISVDHFPPEFVTAKFVRNNPVLINDVPVCPIDPALIESGVEALAYLKGIAEAGFIAYGVQDYPYEKGGTGYKDAPRLTSDVFDLIGTNPAIFGLDSLSLIGMENAWRVPSIEPFVDDITELKNFQYFIEGSALRSIEAWGNGAIPTLSLHMSDPGMVYDQYRKDNINPVTGRPVFESSGKYKWNFHGYGYGNSTRTPVDERDNRERSRHMTMLRLYRAITGAGNEPNDVGVLDVFNAYLDIAADYCLILQSKNIPLLFRPFHENSGDWFWWGNSGCENEDGSYCPEIFKRCWIYIVEYLQKRGVHNCIYVYSPNGPDFDNEEKMGTAAFRPYAITYPGDEWVDICAFDDYTTNEEVLKSDIEIVTKFAAEHGKIAAASEVTGSPVNPIITEYLVRTLTDTAHLPRNLAYFLQWTPPSFAPYLVSPSRANSGAANGFIKTLNDLVIITSDRTCGFKTVKKRE